MRIQALDKVRGIILIIMAMDHAKDMIGKNLNFQGEFWKGSYPIYDNPILFFTRLIAHICAPSFAFMMGLSMILLWNTHKSKWAHESKVWQYFCSRGLILILFEIFIFSPIWSFIFKSPTINFGFAVIAMLGSLMILSSFFIKRHWIVIFIAMVLSIFLPPLIVQTELQKNENYNFFLKMLFFPDRINFIYPIFPWFGVSLMGVLFGKILIKKEKFAFLSLLPLGIVFISLFTVTRFWGGVYFNSRDLRFINDTHWWNIFNMVKYPPSLSYLLFTLGIFFFLFFTVYSIEKYGSKKIFLISTILEIANIYGKSTFFFYGVHLILYTFIGIILCDVLKWNSLSDIAYGWIIILAILYPLCKWYREFKKKQNENSLWRML
ncbi:DUF1624 domain-containing protein [Fluviispira multicolorata]|nr:heparan-alpha-glucosaminide N-acetyltransferase domain-containing protein [Fluviispira multicolorata]